MNGTGGIRLVDQFGIKQALAPVVPSSAAPAWVSLKNVKALTILISVKNATTVTGSAIALSQATAVAGTGAKTLAFTQGWRNLDTAAGETLSNFAVVSNTFTTDNTNSKNLLYAIEVNPEDLDITNKFTSVRVTVGDATAATVDVVYIIQPYYTGNVAKMPAFNVD